MHMLYLWMWVKQGLIGLLLLIAVLAVAARTGVQNARRLPPIESGWCAAAAAATAYSAALALTNFSMAQVNSTFPMVMLWGIALSLGDPPAWRFVWRAAHAPRPEG